MRAHSAPSTNSFVLTKSIYMRILAVQMAITTAIKCTRLKLAAADSASRSEISECSEKRSALAVLETFSGDCCSGLADKNTAHSVQYLVAPIASVGEWGAAEPKPIPRRQISAAMDQGLKSPHAHSRCADQAMLLSAPPRKDDQQGEPFAMPCHALHARSRPPPSH